MTSANFGWRRALAFAALALALVAPAHAQQSLGDIARACGALDANRALAISATGGVPVGSVLVASVAARGDVLADLAIADPQFSAWLGIGARRTRAGAKLDVAQLATRVSAAVAVGQAFSVRLGAAEPGTAVCVAIAAFADVATGSAALQSRAAAGGSGTTLALTGGAPGDGSPQLLLAAFALDGDPAGFTAAQGGDSAASVCNASVTLCLGTVFRADPGTGALTLGATLGTSVNWSGALASLDRDTLLRNGFE